MKDNYKVYVHIAPNGKRYYGITKQKVEKRWQNGKRYSNNEHFTNAINKYGWNEGFEHIKTNSGEDVLIGDFNGRKSHIYIVTNRNKVYRIMVAYADYVSEAQIKINYNNLLSQFKKSEKYVELDESGSIPDDEDISYEILVHKKTYDSSFWVKPNFTDEETAQIQKDVEAMDEEDALRYAMQKALDAMNGQVWLRISEEGYDRYEICIYYDNLLNKANGEEL